MRLIFFAAVLSASSTTAMALPPVIERSTQPGRPVVLYTGVPYISDRGCIPLPASQVDTSPKPKLGRVDVAVQTVKYNGPCGRMAYTRQTITYVPGQSGVDEFNLYYFFNTRTTGPDVARVRIAVGTQPVGRARPESASLVSAPADPITRAPARGGTISGRYVNQLGNILDVRRGLVYFTGFWNKQPVSNKPFAMVSQSANAISWSNYSCSGGSEGFVCVPPNGEQRVYRRLR